MRHIRSSRWLVLALLIALLPASSFAGVFVSVGFAPPVLPVYVQPPCPEPGMIWTPGYWAYGPDGYYWVPGAWVPSPYVGALWTPPWWGWGGGVYVFHPGYWGPHVGYYGGVNYGFGYMGVGFVGGAWRGGVFAYNTAVVNVNRTVIHNTYIDRTVVERNTIVNNNHVAYSGGPGGINHPAMASERMAERDQHLQATSFQQQHVQTAQTNHDSYARFNGGHPQNAAVSRPLAAESHPAPAMTNRGGAGFNANAQRGFNANANANAQRGFNGNANANVQRGYNGNFSARGSGQVQQQYRPMPQQSRPAPQYRQAPQPHNEQRGGGGGNHGHGR